MLTHQRHLGGVQEISILASCWACNIQYAAIYHDPALSRVETKGRKNLDSFAGCGIISTHVLFS
jgi:hypothetical protein